MKYIRSFEESDDRREEKMMKKRKRKKGFLKKKITKERDNLLHLVMPFAKFRSLFE